MKKMLSFTLALALGLALCVPALAEGESAASQPTLSVAKDGTVSAENATYIASYDPATGQFLGLVEPGSRVARDLLLKAMHTDSSHAPLSECAAALVIAGSGTNSYAGNGIVGGAEVYSVTPLSDVVPYVSVVQYAGRLQQLQLNFAWNGEKPSGYAMTGIVNRAAVQIGSREFSTNDVYYNRSNEECYINIDSAFYNDWKIGEQGTGLTLSLEMADGTTVTMRNDAFSYQYAEGPALAQNYEITSDETAKRFYFTGLSTDAMWYFGVCLINNDLRTQTLNQDFQSPAGTTRFYFGGPYFNEYSSFAGRPVSLYRMSAGVEGNALTMTVSEGIPPFLSGKTLPGNAPVDSTKTIAASFVRNEVSNQNTFGYLKLMVNDGSTFSSHNRLDFTAYKRIDGNNESPSVDHDNVMFSTDLWAPQLVGPYLTNKLELSEPYYRRYCLIDASGNETKSLYFRINAIHATEQIVLTYTGSWYTYSETDGNGYFFATRPSSSGFSYTTPNYLTENRQNTLRLNVSRENAEAMRIWRWDLDLTPDKDGVIDINLTYYDNIQWGDNP